jgi:hypothetical protein
MSELHISQAFREHQAHPIPTLYEPVASFCWNQVLYEFFRELMWSYKYMQSCGWNYPDAEGQGLKKIVCSTYKILVLHFISPFFFFVHGSTWRHLQCDCYELIVKFWFSSINFNEVHSVEVWSLNPREQK